MKRIVHLAIYEGISDWEFGYVIAHINSPELQQNNHCYEVKTVGRDKNSVKSKGGITMLPDLTLDELNPIDSEMLILCGSDNAAIGGISDFIQKARLFIEQNKSIAAICGATAALAKEGLLDERSHTSNSKEFMEMTGYSGSKYYVNAPAVTCNRVITASGIEPVAFAIEIFKTLNLYSEKTLSSWEKLFYQRDINGFFELLGEVKSNA
ncbi:DJ-1/PfpI family protein [Vibrio owensii]|uniref:DJ-1/PfpI family protein n=1 Tax=Vibrio owensii TaxID=696485 RepID=UPI003CE52DBE